VIRVRKRFGPLVINECWNGFDGGLLKGRFSFCSFFNVDAELSPEYDLYEEEYRTVCNDLLLPEDEIFSAFTKQTRNAIRQTQIMEVGFDMETSLVDFIPFFNDFAKNMNIRRTSERKLKEYGQNMEITSAYYKGIICAAHSYIIDRENKTVVLYQSASRRMIADDIDKGLLGKLNKALHFEDMKFFKARGFKLYDFGGYFEDRSRGENKKRGVNDFKLLFGGDIVKYRNYYTTAFWYFNKLRIFAKEHFLRSWSKKRAGLVSKESVRVSSQELQMH